MISVYTKESGEHSALVALDGPRELCEEKRLLATADSGGSNSVRVPTVSS